MRSYFKADLHRVFGRTPRMIAMAILCMVCAVAAFVASRAGEDSLLSAVPLLIDGSLVTMIGVVEMGCVYGDDFKAKSMQIGIGSGISRSKVVFAKMLQLMTVTAMDIAAIFFFRFAGTFFGTFSLESFAVKSELFTLVCIWIQVVVLICVVSCIMYHFQNTTVALLAFLVLNLGILGSVISFIEGALNITGFQLENYLVTDLLNNLRQNLGTSPVSVTTILGITAYTLLGLVLACAVFKRKELEF